MPDIGIRINVDDSQVISAHQRLEKLAQMKKTSGLDIDIPMSVADATTQMRNSNLGGSTEKAARSAGQFRREMESSRKAVSDITKDYEKLIRITAGFKGSRPDTFGAPTSPVSSAESTRMRREAAREAAKFWESVNSSTTPPRKTAAQQFFEQHGHHGNTVISHDDDTGGAGGSGSSGRSNNRMMRRVLGWGAAAAGLGSIAGFIGSARQSYRQALDEEQPLFARGLVNSRKRAGMAANLGISPEQYLHMEDALSRTGIDEKRMGKNAMLTASFSKFSGIDTADVTGLRSQLYHATGSNDTIPNDVITAMGKATAAGLKSVKLPELLSLIGRNTQATAQAMHGAGVSGDQIGAITSLAINAMALKDGTSFKQFAKSEQFGNIMQNGFQGDAGSPAGNIILAEALGVFDGTPNFAKIHKINKLRTEGPLMHPELLEKIIGRVKSIAGSDDKDAQAGALESFMPSWGVKGAASEMLIAMTDSGFLKRAKGKNIEKMAAGGDVEAKRWMEEIAKNPALGRQSTEATKDLVKIEAGEKLSKLFEPLELSAAKLTGALADGKWQESFGIFSNAAKELGPFGKTVLAAGTLFAAGGALSAVGGALGLGKSATGGVAGLLPMMRGMVTNPLGAAAILGGSVAYFGSQNDASMKTGLTDNQLQYRLNQLEVAGADRGPEADRIRAEQAKRKKTGSAPRPAGYFKYRDVISAASQKYGVPEHLLAGLIESESGFVNHPDREVKLKSGKSIRVGGLGQFTDETAKRYKINKMDPYQSIDGAANYLKDLAGATGDWTGAISKYKGIQSPEKQWQAETAITASRKYQAADGGSDTATTTNQMIVDILKVIAGHTEQTATNSGFKPITAQVIATK